MERDISSTLWWNMVRLVWWDRLFSTAIKKLEGHTQQGEKILQLFQVLEDKKNELHVTLIGQSDWNFKWALNFNFLSVLSGSHENTPSWLKYSQQTIITQKQEFTY